MGMRGSSRLQRVGGRESGLPSGEEGGVIVGIARGGVNIATFGDGDRFHLGENEGWEEGLYRSNELTREKA